MAGTAQLRVAEPQTDTITDLWDLREFGPQQPQRDGAVLLLPGAMCTSAFYDQVVADPRVGGGDTRWIAATPPGFGGRPVPPKFIPTIEAYAEITSDLAAELGVDTIVAHSYFANVAIEMAATGRFSGRLVLISPCFSTEDEESDTRSLGKLAGTPVVGRVVWTLLPKMMGVGMKGRFPEDRQASLVAEMKRFNGKVTRQLVRYYFEHLEAHEGSIATRLCGSGLESWVVKGADDEVGLSDQPRAQIQGCATIKLVTVPDGRHFLMADQPGAVVDVVLQAIQSGYGR
ncbi:MAG TPA: alpha/beta hydrolase [Acidimicrobiales bacterium]|jgi:pimeloyl-ACP methyl ester carboxylesterase